MNDRDIIRQERIERIEVFGKENSADWAADSGAAQRYAKNTEFIAGLNDARIGQVRTPVTEQTLLDALWEDFKNIARTARAIDLDEPGFAASYRLPDNPTEDAIKAHADNLPKLWEDNDAPADDGGDTPEQKAAKAALRAKFAAYFLPANFVADMRAERDAVDAKNTAKTADNLNGVENTAEIERLLREAGENAAHLDAMMQNLYARNPAKLRAWLAASRLERAPQREKKPAPPVNVPLSVHVSVNAPVPMVTPIQVTTQMPLQIGTPLQVTMSMPPAAPPNTPVPSQQTAA